MSWIVLCCLFCSCLLSGVETGTVKLVRNRNGLWLSERVADSGRSYELVPRMILGPEQKVLGLKLSECSDEEKELRVSYSNRLMDWQIRFIPRGAMLLAVSSLKNLTDRELWLEPSLCLKLKGCGNAEMFWSGFGDVQKIGRNCLSRKGIKGVEEKHVAASTMPFPASAVGGRTGAVFLGNVIFDPLSYTGCSYNPKTEEFSYALRVVLPPGKAVSVRHTLGASRVDYGFPEMIVQQYYEAFPECFAPVRGQENPYIWGNHGSYLNWWQVPDFEESRRLDVTIEWTYCPYKRSGDMLVRPDLWDYKPHNPFRKSKMFGRDVDWKNISRKDFLKFRQDIFNGYGQRLGLMFYNTVAGLWCEDQLANKYYSDALTKDRDVSHTLSVWSTHHDKELRVFPMGTSFAGTFFHDMEKLADTLDLPGFALDCVYGGAHYRGPAVAKDLPGKAWDEKGVFIDQNVALNREVDWIHNLRKDPDRKLTCFINGYLKGDYVMVEASYVQTGTMHRWMPLLRWYIGPRPGCMHKHGYHFPDLVPDWRNKTQKDFRTIMPKLTDFIIMSQFKWGLTDSPLTFRGCPQLSYVQPEAQELMRAGWQATIPAVLEDGMRVPYLSRYGRGVNSFFFFGNSAATEVRGRIRLDCSALNDNGEKILFVRKMRRKAQSVNEVQGDFTCIDAVLPSRVPVLYEAVASLKPAQNETRWDVQAEKSLQKRIFRLKYLSGGPFRSLLWVRDMHDFHLAEVKLDGRRISLEQKQLFRPGCLVEIVYRSDLFHVDEMQILQFPFTDKAKMVDFKVCAPADGEAEKLAGRFNEYFEFCRSHRLTAKNSPKVVIEKMASYRPQAKTVTMMIGSDRPAEKEGIYCNQAGGLDILAKDVRQMEKMLKALFRIMDQRYEYIFPFRSVMGVYGQQLTHFRMWNQAFPYEKYFEGVR